MRGFAALSVFLAHFGAWPSQYFNFIDAVVDLFFVLSAFTLSQSLLFSLHQNNKINYAGFLARRAIKILPSYLFFMAVGLLIAYVVIKPLAPTAVVTLSELPQYLLFYRNYGGPPARATLEHLWSMSVEVQFYLLLPLLFLFVQAYFKSDIKYLKRIVIGLIIIGISIKVQAIFTDFADWPTYSHNRIDGFAWGILTSIFIFQKGERREGFVNNIKIALLGSAILILIYLLKMPFDEHELVKRIFAPIGWCCIIIGTFDKRWQALNFLKVISRYSYNCYLWHYLFIIPIIHYFGFTLKGFLIYAVVTGIVTYLITHYLENKVNQKQKSILAVFNSK